jgi:large subunit ribosomal protein L24
MDLKKGDNVQVLSGNDKGKTGEILAVLPKANKVIVKGVNVRTKHVKPRGQKEEGGIKKEECPIAYSKVNIVCPKCKSVTRIAIKENGDKKIRVCKKCNEKIK